MAATPSPGSPPDERVGLAEAAFRHLRDDIVRLERAPGSVLREDDLIRELGVGRTPVREALKRLELEHLVVIAPRSATRVSPADVDDIHRVDDVRGVLEPEAARLAARRVTDSWRERADILIAEMRKPSLDAVELMRLDEQVHRLIWDGSENRLLIGTLDSYFSLSVRIGFMVLAQAPDYARSIVSEVEILAAIAAGDARTAARLMGEHVRTFSSEAVRTLSARQRPR